MGDAPIKYRLNEKKATQVAAWLLKKHGGTLSDLSLMKLLYIADRENLRENSRPLVGDLYVSMNKGPVLSNVLNLMTGKGSSFTPRTGYWDRYIKLTAAYELTLVEDPGTGLLSEDDERLLEQLSNDCTGMDKWDLVELTHAFPEWESPDGSSTPIPVEKILRKLGKTEVQIQRIREEAAEDYLLGGILNS